MSQSTKILGALMIGFFIFVTVRGELPAYLALLGIGSGKVVTS